MEDGAQDGVTESSDTGDVIKSLTQNLSPEALQSALTLAVAIKNASQDEYNAVLKLLSKPKVAPDSEEKPSVEADGYSNDNSLEKLQQLSELSDQDEEVGKVENSTGDSVEMNGEGEGKDGHVADENTGTDNNSFKSEDKSVVTPTEDQKFLELSDEEEKMADELSVADEKMTLNNEAVDTYGDPYSLEQSLQAVELSDKDSNIGDCIKTGVGNDVNAAFDGQEDSKNDFVADEQVLHNLSKTTSDNSFDSIDKSIVTPSEEQKLSEFPYEAERLADQPSTTDVNSASFLRGNVSSSEDEKLPELLPGKAEDINSEIEDLDGKEPMEIVSGDIETNEDSIVEGTPSLQHLSSMPQSIGTEIMENNESKTDDGESSSSSDENEMASSSSHSVVMSSENDLSDAAVPSDSLANQSEGLKGEVIQFVEAADSSLSMSGFKDDDIAVIEDEMTPTDTGKEPASVTVPVLERMSSLSSTGTQTSYENLHLLKDPRLKTHPNLDSILGGNEQESSKLPFYYQPQIVMHEEKPVLILQPVPSSTSSSDGNDNVPGLENGAVKATVPIILPLASSNIDKKTKEAIFQQMNRAGTFLVDQGDVEESDPKAFFLENSSGGVSPTVIADVTQQNGKYGGEHLLGTAGHDTPINDTPVAENLAEQRDSWKTEGLPEWVPSSELDKALSAATEEIPVSTEQQKAITLAFPRVSLPSTNPFAKDLAVQQSGHYEVEADSLLNFGLGETPQCSLFGPPSSPTLLQGARPKEIRTYQDPGIIGSGTNPFTPDPPKKQGRRHEQKTPSSTEVVVAAEVHTSMGQPAEINGTPRKSHRRRLSSESMVTLIETSYADTSVSCVESMGVDEPPRTARSDVQDPQPQPERNEARQESEKPKQLQQGSKETTQDTEKPKMKVPGKVAPLWVPDSFCFNCTGCNVKFTIFIRKHHCRGCGKIFCNTCCSQLARFPYMDFKIGRVCKSCTEAIKEVSRLKNKDVASKPGPVQQAAVNNQKAARIHGVPPTSSASQTSQLPQGVVVTNAHVQRNSLPSSVPQTRQLPPGVVAMNTQPQRNLQSQPLSQVPRTSTPSTVAMPLNEGLQGSVMLNQPVQYQPMTWPPKSSVKVQNVATPVPALVPSNQSLQGSQGLIRPAQPANQYMWVPASAVQQPMPVVYVNPVAPSLQGGPMLVTYPPARPFIPQQAPVMLLTSQPSSTSPLVRTTIQGALTTTSGNLKNVVPVSNRSSSGTVTTFSVLPQHVGQAAVLSAEGHNARNVKTTTTTTTTATVNNHATSTSSVVPSSSIQTSSSQSHHQTISSPSQQPSVTGATNTGLPFPSSLDLTPPPSVTTTAPSQRLSHAVVSSSSGDRQSQESLTESSRSRESDGSVLVSDETDPSTKDLQPPIRRAGRTITWRYRTQGKSKLQEQKKSLSKDLKDLPNGITVQAASDLLVHIKKLKLKEGMRDISVWCYQSEGLDKFNHLEVVVLIEVRKKEEIFPEEVLRVYRGILHLAAKLDNRFQHGNYLSSNNQFLDSRDDAGFILVSSQLKSIPMGLKEMKTPFLYGILVKRSELSAAMFTPSRLLLQLGNQANSFPFPLWNNRDRKPILLGNEHEDRFFHTVFAMNKYLKNSVPEAMIPGLYVVKEENKIILQIPKSGQSAIVALLDRLIKKENQTATVPLLADIPPYVDNCRVVVCSESGGKTVKSFGNATSTSVVGLGFLLLHLGVDASSPLNFGGELLDDGVLIFFSKAHTQKLRQSLEAKTNCYFFLGDKFDIAHFELRWVRDLNYHELSLSSKIGDPFPATTTADTTAKEPGADSYPGLATIDVHSGFGNEVELLKKEFDDYGKILQILEGNIRQACTDPLMKHANKMKSGDNEDLQLRVVLRPSYKKWSVGPSDLPTVLIRSLQMALHTVKVPVVFEGELVMSFYVSVLKQ